MEAMLDLDRIKTTTVTDMEEQATPIVVLPNMPQVPRLCHLQCVSAMTGYGLPNREMLNTVTPLITLRAHGIPKP